MELDNLKAETQEKLQSQKYNENKLHDSEQQAESTASRKRLFEHDSSEKSEPPNKVSLNNTR